VEQYLKPTGETVTGERNVIFLASVISIQEQMKSLSYFLSYDVFIKGSSVLIYWGVR